jgi:glutaredoxin 3
MMRIILYGTHYCGFCRAAKQLLSAKGFDFAEIDVAEEPGRREEMVARAGGRLTVPQIFIDGTHVGGYEELVDLDRAGKLDSWLKCKAEGEAPSAEVLKALARLLEP